MLKICFTGHRPNKLYGYDLNNIKYKKLESKIKEEVLNIIHNNDDKEYCFITGGALGLDQLAFNTIELGRQILQYKLIQEIAISFKDQPNAWFKIEDKNRYDEQLKLADKITYVDTLEEYKIKGYQEGRYYPAKMQKRNEYMVDNSDIVIAVWDGIKRGGTYNCVKYAQKLNKQMIIINPKEA